MIGAEIGLFPTESHWFLRYSPLLMRIENQRHHLEGRIFLFEKISKRMVGGTTVVSILRLATKLDSERPLNLLLILIKDMRRKTPMRSEHLPCHCFAYSQILLRNKSNMVSLRIQNHILVRLFKPKQNVHHLQLPFNNDG